MGRCGLNSSVSGQGPVMDFCKHGNELSGCIKHGKFLEYKLNDS
jgi:hypothetical protein